MNEIFDLLKGLQPHDRLGLLLLIVMPLMLFLVIRLERRFSAHRRGLARKLEQLRQDWIERTERQLTEARQRLEDVGAENHRVAEESARLDREVEELGLEVKAAVGKVEHFEQQFQALYRAELARALQAFDQTVLTVLGEMKGELQRGVSQIDEIQRVVLGKKEMQGRLLSRGLLAEERAEPPAPAAPDNLAAPGGAG